MWRSHRMNDQANSVDERYVAAAPATLEGWNRHDTTWMLGLFGTAIGAGTLFLPINAGLGGFWPLMVLAVLAFPMTFYAHRGLTRFVLSGREGADITAHAQHAHVVAILLTKQRHGAFLFGGFNIGFFSFNRGVLAN